jgi:acetylornithine deacetylase/succinyl-diaminopimelate desuccinylase-like protein
MAAALPRPQGAAMRLLLRPRVTNLLLDRIGDRARMLDPLLHNTASPTVLQSDDKFNVIPGEVTAVLDGRLLPGFSPDDMLTELRALLGNDLDLEVMHFDASPAEPDMGLFPTLAGILERADPGSTATPLLMPGVSDGRFFARLGIQTYGFLPLKLPAGFDFWSGVHGADERVPAGAVEFGANAVHEALARFGEAKG